MTVRHFSLGVGIAIVAFLLGVAFLPPDDAPYASAPHDLLHVAAYAILALAWVHGLPRVPAFVVALAVAAFGVLHEALEIAGHSHAFEPSDAIMDAVGAALGGFVGQIARNFEIRKSKM